MKNNETLIKHFINQYQQSQLADNTFFKSHREKALNELIAQGLPGKKDEFWRKTDWEKYLVEKQNYLPNPNGRTFKPLGNRHFALIDGQFYGEKLLMEYENGIIAGSLAAAIEKYPEIFERFFGRLIKPKYRNLVHLNAIFFFDGFFLYVPENVVEKEIFRIENIISSDQNQTHLHTRNLIIVEKNSRVSVEIMDRTEEKAKSFVTDLTEIYVEEKARFDYFRLQNLNEQTTLVNMIYSDNPGAESMLDGFIMTYNGEYVRNEIQSKLSGKACDVSWNGIYLPEAEQKTDNRIFIEHDTTEAQSNQHFKGILKDQSQAFFNGYILVDRGAQQTNAYQQNANILLSRQAKVSSMPFLEIYADDVACSHGSTTGQLDDEAIFYLQQRGIDPETARQMILYSFIEEIIVKMPFESWKEEAEKELKNKWETIPETIEI